MFDFTSTNAHPPSSHTRSKLSSQSHSSKASSPSCFDPTSFTDQGTDTILAPPKAWTPRPFQTFPSTTNKAESPIKYRAHNQASEKPTITKCELPSFVTPRFEEHTVGSQQEIFHSISSYSLSKTLNFTPSLENSPLPSPTKDKWSFLPGFNETKATDANITVKGSRLADWFKGESDAISIGILPSPTKEKFDPLDKMWSQNASKSQPKPAPTTAPRPSVPTTSRFSFFTSKPCQPPPLALNTDDEFAHLDIKTALQPTGQSDPFSPSSFKNLLQNAEGLLSRLQFAYKQRTLSLQEALAEKDAQAEELEEAQIRARHLKIQLDDMTTKLAEQDKAMMDMVDELVAEKQARRNEEDVRKRTIRIVDATMETPNSRGGNRPRQHRISRASTVSDSGFESDEESSADSVFSKQQRASSPTMSVTTSNMSSPEVYQDSEFPQFAGTPSVRQQKPKAIHAITQTPASTSISAQKGLCENCHGVGASEAWSVVGVLKQENICLKQRVGHLEGEVDGCLELVRGLGI